MNRLVPADFKQFSMLHLFAAVVSVSIAAAIIAQLPRVFWFISFCIFAYWAGMVLLFASDAVDSRPIDDRNLFSQTLSSIGSLCCTIAILFGIAAIGIALAYGAAYLLKLILYLLS